MKTNLLPCTLAAVALLSSCGIPPHSFNSAELLDPPDKRVALINGSYPTRWQSGFTPTATWRKDGTTYYEVTVQYAKAHRPIIRALDNGFYAPALSPEETTANFTIDSSLPAQSYLISDKGKAIPKHDFNFNGAKALPPHTQPIRNAYFIHLHAALDRPGTASTWRTIAQAPLHATDLSLGVLTNLCKYTLLYGGIIVASPIIIPLQSSQRQQQQEEYQQRNPHKKVTSEGQ
ncbi:MAG: hypothetical protein IJN29_04295 [Akkermansia sp.]|nr:hypothetical protein [Akkermansia sp.]